jgi:hypothetical protein
MMKPTKLHWEGRALDNDCIHDAVLGAEDSAKIADSCTFAHAHVPGLCCVGDAHYELPGGGKQAVLCTWACNQPGGCGPYCKSQLAVEYAHLGAQSLPEIAAVEIEEDISQPVGRPAGERLASADGQGLPATRPAAAPGPARAVRFAAGVPVSGGKEAA